MAYAADHHLDVGFILIALGISGVDAFQRRSDLQEIERLAREGICAHVIWHDASRIARTPDVVLEHHASMTNVGVRVHLTQFEQGEFGVDDLLVCSMLAGTATR